MANLQEQNINLLRVSNSNFNSLTLQCGEASIEIQEPGQGIMGRSSLKLKAFYYLRIQTRDKFPTGVSIFKGIHYIGFRSSARYTNPQILHSSARLNVETDRNST